MKLIGFHTALAMLLLMHTGLRAQDAEGRFTAACLRYPKANAMELENAFTLIEQTRFDFSKQAKDQEVFILENGYAQWKLRKTPALEAFKNYSGEVSKISIVFTRYPLNKKDWITNYHFLLAKRLESIFEIRPELNSKAIDWEIIYQTEGTTAASAKAMFHGIVIHAKPAETHIQTTEQQTDTIKARVPRPVATDRQTPASGFDFDDRDMERFSLPHPLTPVPSELKSRPKPRKRKEPQCPRWK